MGIARHQIENGAQIIDINMDDGLLDAKSEMVHFLNLLSADPDICRIPFMIDSSKWEVIEAGLKCVQGKCVVNSISLKEGEQVFMQRARTIRQFGAAVVVMAFDEKGQADTFERKIEVCQRAFRLLTEVVGMPRKTLFLTPMYWPFALALRSIIRMRLIFFVQRSGFVKTCQEHMSAVV